MFKKKLQKNAIRSLLSGFIICGSLCLALIYPAEAWADDVSLSLNPSIAYAGDKIDLSGIADAQVWVTIKIVDSDGNIVYFNPILTDDEGKYAITYTIPDASPGILEVVAGYGSNVANESLVIKPESRSSGEDNSSTPEIIDSSILIELGIDKKEITVNGQVKVSDTPPMLINSRTMVPLRFIGENLGAVVAWQGETKTVTIKQDKEVIELVIGELGLGLDVPATIINGRTMVPLRYISEKLGAKVTWFSETKSVEILK